MSRDVLRHAAPRHRLRIFLACAAAGGSKSVSVEIERNVLNRGDVVRSFVFSLAPENCILSRTTRASCGIYRVNSPPRPQLPSTSSSSSSPPPPPPLQSVAADWTSIPCLPLARLPVDQCYLRRDIIARAPAQPGEARHTSYTTTTTAAATVTSAAICASFPPHPVSRLYTRVADGGTRLDSRS